MAWVIPQDQSQLLQHIGASLAVALFYDGKNFTSDLDEFLDQQIRDIVTIRVDLNKVKDAVNKYRLVNLPTWRFFSKGVDLKLDVPEEDLDRVKEIITQQLNKQTAMIDIKSFKEYTVLISEKDTVHCVYYYSKSHPNYDYMSKVDSFSLKHDHAKFYSVDIDKFKDICKMNDLEGVHTIHFFTNGEKLPIRSTPPFKDFEKTISEYLYTYDRKKKDIQGQSLRRRGASLSTKREMPESERLQIQTGDDRPRTGSASPIEMTSNRVERRSTLTRRVVVESDENIADKKVVDDRNIVDQKDSLRIEKSDALPRKILVSGEQSKFRLI